MARESRPFEEVAGSVAHGLNNLLGAVVAQAEELLATLPDDVGSEVRETQLRLIHQSALDAADLVRRLLRLSRGEALEYQDRRELVDVGPVLADAVELTRVRWQDEARARGVTIETTVEVERPLLVRAVAADLREIVVNLILNAVDALPDGGHLVLRGVARDGTVVVTCQDSGIGMAPEVAGRVFDPFFTTKGERGNGLGLAIVHDVVGQLGGQVRVASERGFGTTFTLLLPAARPPVESVSLAVARKVAANDLTAGLATLSVLVVDDDPVFRAIFARRLGLDASRVEAVGDAASALAALAEDSWDLVCVDDGLPDRSGRDLAAEIRRRHPDCAVILVTGAATRPDDPNLASPGVDAILPKPCTDAELARALRTARHVPR